MTHFPHIDDDEYEIIEPAGNETVVKVRIDDRRNGGHVGAYLKTLEGDRLQYERFRIKNVDRREMNHLGEGDPHPDVVHSLHAGGWAVANSDPPVADIDRPPLSNVLVTLAEFLEGHRDEFYSRMTVGTATVTVVALRQLANSVHCDNTGQVLGMQPDGMEAMTPEQVEQVSTEDPTGPALLNLEDGVEAYPDRLPYEIEIDEHLDAVRAHYHAGMEWEEAVAEVWDSIEWDGDKKSETAED